MGYPLCVDAVAGNDANNGREAIQGSGVNGPKKTLQAAVNAVPDATGGYQIYLAPRGNPGGMLNAPYAGTDGNWNEIIGDTDCSFRDGNGNGFAATPGPVVCVGRVTFAGSNYGCIVFYNSTASYWRTKKIVAVNPGASTVDFGMYYNLGTKGEFVDCVGISPTYGILMASTASTPEHGCKLLRCVGKGAPGIFLSGGSSSVKQILADECVALMCGAAAYSQYEGAFIVDTYYVTIRHTAAITGLGSTANNARYAFKGGASGKAEMIRNVAWGYVAAQNFQAGSTFTDCRKFGGSDEANWTRMDTPPYLLLPQLHKGSPIADILPHLAGLTGESAFDLLGFDRSGSSQTPGPVECEPGKREVGYPGYKDGRGIGWMGDLIASGGGAFSPIGSAIVRGRV